MFDRMLCVTRQRIRRSDTDMTRFRRTTLLSFVLDKALYCYSEKNILLSGNRC